MRAHQFGRPGESWDDRRPRFNRAGEVTNVRAAGRMSIGLLSGKQTYCFRNIDLQDQIRAKPGSL